MKELRSGRVKGKIKPTHKAVKKYYTDLEKFSDFGIGHELAVRSAFQNLLETTAKPHGWHLITELGIKKAEGGRAVPDGTLKNDFNMDLGWWEAKDSKDNLDKEIKKKIAAEYPTINTIFENTQTAVLYQDGSEVLRVDLKVPKQLVELLNTFFAHKEPDIETFEKAVEEFKERVPQLAEGLVKIINEAHEGNREFQKAFDVFFKLCQDSLNPNIRIEAVDEMIVQHLLTERLFRRIFDDPDFIRRNIIANEVENVIDALVSKTGNRQEFLRPLDRFYVAIEDAARSITSFSDKQHFLNIVYEQFFQGYSVKVADTMGIIYTPQPLVNFMCESVEEVLKKEFGLSLGSRGVNILDPCTGTGNFIVNIMGRISKRDLPRMYREQLFANEVMLLPYYIAALNIEHEYKKKTGEYEPFEGLCFVDTLDMAGHDQGNLFLTRKNTARVDRQKSTPITVIIGNPPYNTNQLNENDNNRNRKYEEIDKRIQETYSKDSKATNKNKLYDPYVKFFRWATDRLNKRDGIVCFVSNNSFVDSVAFDGMRKHLAQDFNIVYHVDLHGNVRQNPKISGTTHNVFGIQVGVGITIAVRAKGVKKTRLKYYRLSEDWRKEEKYKWLLNVNSVHNVSWQKLNPDKRYSWILPKHWEHYQKFVPLAAIGIKDTPGPSLKYIFKLLSNGIQTNRDEWGYGFDKEKLLQKIKITVEAYNSELSRWIRAKQPDNVDDFILSDERKIKWCSRLKEVFRRSLELELTESNVRLSLYRPFNKRFLYFDPSLTHRRGQFPRILPSEASEKENKVICLQTIASTKPFHCIVTNTIPELHLTGDSQCFPYYIYDEDGSNRTENITDWARDEFRKHYKKSKISQWDIFYYIYGLLNHPGYKAKYADCFKHELPRIPFAPDFKAFSKVGKELAKWHLDYEQVEPYELEWVEDEEIPLSYAIEDRMRLSKDKTEIKFNDSLTLKGIPPEAFEYRLGNRSALEWVIDQYRVKTFPRSGIKSDPNRPDDPQYILRLIGKVIKVSLETVRIVRGLPKDFGG